MDIIWGHPKALLCLWALIPLAALLLFAHKKRKATALRFADAKMVSRLMPAFSGARPWVKGTLLILGFASLGIAVARPRWGEYFETVQQRGVDVMVLLDVSRSMLSSDVAPRRLDRAKADIQDLLGELQGERVGLVVFAGKAVLACPLTTDHGFFKTILDEVGPDSAPRGGTLIGDAVRMALKSMEERRDRDQALLLITDGEDQDSYPRDAASLAAERAVKIIAVGLGDPETGSRIPIEDEFGNITYMKHEGQEVWSRMDEELLREMALKTEGVYVPARTDVYDLGVIYDKHVATLEGSDMSSRKRKRFRERFQVFVGLGLMFFFLELLIRNYSREAKSAMSGMLILGLACTMAPAASARSEEAVDFVESGLEAFRRGDFEEAKKQFQEADVALPENEIVEFNQGVVLQFLGESEESRPLYERASSSRDLDLAIRARYNLGTLSAAEGKALAGEDPASLSEEQRNPVRDTMYRAVRQFRACLELDKNHENARHNIELIRLWLKHMEDVWAERDRQEQRDELDLLAFIEALRKAQGALRIAVGPIQDLPDSPRSREARRQLSERQGELFDEIEPLKEKVSAQFESMNQGGPGTQGAPPNAPSNVDPAQMQKAIDQFHKLADEAGQSLLTASEDLDDGLFDQAIESQVKANGIFEDLWNSLSPFEKTLQEAVQTQESVVETLSDWNGEEEVDEESPYEGNSDEGNSDEETPEADESTSNNQEPTEDSVSSRETKLLSESQHWVRKLSQALAPKAEMTLKQLPSAQDQPVPEDETDEQRQQREAMEEQMASLKMALEKAIESGPPASENAQSSAAALESGDHTAAQPNAKEALRLLQEIQDLMPKNEQEENQDQENQDEENQDQENQDEENQDEENQDEENQDEENQDEENQDEENQDEENQDEENQDEENQDEENQENEDDSGQSNQERKPMTPQQAEALLRQAMEQERDFKDRRRKALMRAGGKAKVDRDW